MNPSRSGSIRFDRHELAGAFGDIGTDLPLVVPSYGTREEDRCSAESSTTWRGLEIRGGWHLGLLSELDGQRGSREASAPRRVTLISILAAIDLVCATDFVAVLPERMVANKADTLGLEILELPHSSAAFPSKSLSLQMLSHRNHGTQPAVMWLRELLSTVANELAAQPTYAPFPRQSAAVESLH